VKTCRKQLKWEKDATSLKKITWGKGWEEGRLTAWSRGERECGGHAKKGGGILSGKREVNQRGKEPKKNWVQKVDSVRGEEKKTLVVIQHENC